MDISSIARLTGSDQFTNQRNEQVPSSGFENMLKEAYSFDKSVSTEVSFEYMWKTRFPGAKYHVIDASKISQGTWERNDFPFEKFFEGSVDASVLNWKPTGKDPDMADSGVQARLDSTLGGKAVIVPPELEEKMKNNPELAQKVMDRVDRFIANHPTRPGRILSYLISLDENGNIARFRVTGGGGHISGPSEEELRQFEAVQKEKQERKAKAKRETEEHLKEVAVESARLREHMYHQQSLEAMLHAQLSQNGNTSFANEIQMLDAAYLSGLVSSNIMPSVLSEISH